MLMLTEAQQKENRTAWARALRSGKFEQTQGTLADGDAYCCLGVACELFITAHPDGTLRRVGDTYESEDGLRNDVDLPAVVCKWLGVDESAGFTHPEYQYEDLATLNDDGADFEEIAVVIETIDDRESQGHWYGSN